MKNNQEPVWLKVIRILLAAVFLFSGFVKAVDPIAFSHTISDYFFSFKMGFMQPFSLFFAILPITAEFVLGFMLLFRIRVKLTTAFYLLFMVFFFLLTAWLALAEHLETHHGYNFGVVKDCGCFGKAIVMSNLHTFLKNVLIIIPTIIVFIKRNKIPDIRLTVLGQWCFAALGVLLVSLLQFYCYQHLPIIDFGDWKKGENVAKTFIEKPAKKDILFIYREITDSTNFKVLTAEELSSITDSQSDFYEKFTFVERRDSIIVPAYHPEIAGFNMIDSSGYDHAFELINEASTHNVYIVFMYDLYETDKEGVKRIKRWATGLDATATVVAVTNSPENDVTAFIKEHNFTIPIYINPIDPIKGPFAVRDAVRANPGVIQIRSGKVFDKWNWRELSE
ncbi:MAG: DoxX family protein [Bacteroidales bacterium]|jgi:uncharacterized membrane protein YphA (DoxX/SURF4 family)|nr:DoxX family protein [Bacteroidales bacterium]